MSSKSREAKHRQRVIEMNIRFWTKDIPWEGKGKTTSKQIKFFIIGLGFFTLLAYGCSTLGEHGMGSTADNWYKSGVSSNQTAADLTDCRERSGYSHSFAITERAAYMFDSYIENCMTQKGYTWYQSGKLPGRGVGVSPEQTAVITPGATSVRPLNR